MAFYLITTLCLLASFGAGVYFADVVKRYVTKGLTLIIGEIEDTPKKK